MGCTQRWWFLDPGSRPEEDWRSLPRRMVSSCCAEIRQQGGAARGTSRPGGRMDLAPRGCGMMNPISPGTVPRTLGAVSKVYISSFRTSAWTFFRLK